MLLSNVTIINDDDDNDDDDGCETMYSLHKNGC